MKVMSNAQPDNSRQQGFVAIIVASMIMVILALITIGFTRVMQREQRQVLDRQLSRQALYAAESGINDVYAAIQDGSFPDPDKTDCDPTGVLNDGVIDGSGSVAYTCVQYDTRPTEIVYELSPNESEIAQFETRGDNFNSITINWGISAGSNNLGGLPNCGDLDESDLPPSRPTSVPVIRVDLSVASTLTRSSLVQNSEFIYALPCNSASAASVPTTHIFNSLSRADVVPVACFGQGSRPCTLVLDGLTANKYVSRLKSVYTSANVSITGREGVADDSAKFVGLQTVIDVTARSNDIVRRLRATVPFSNIDDLTGIPEGVFHSFDGVCKLLGVDTTASPAIVESSCP